MRSHTSRRPMFKLTKIKPKIKILIINSDQRDQNIIKTASYV